MENKRQYKRYEAPEKVLLDFTYHIDAEVDLLSVREAKKNTFRTVSCDCK